MERSGNDEGDLVLTPAKLRLDSTVVALYTTGTWLMHSLFLTVLMLQVSPCSGTVPQEQVALTALRCNSMPACHVDAPSLCKWRL